MNRTYISLIFPMLANECCNMEMLQFYRLGIVIKNANWREAGFAFHTSFGEQFTSGVRLSVYLIFCEFGHQGLLFLGKLCLQIFPR